MIYLEKFTKSDYAQLISWVDSEEALMQFAGPAFTFPLTADQLDQSLNDVNRYAFKVIDEDTCAVIGFAELYLTEQSVYLGRILIGDEKLRGHGKGKKIIAQLLAYAFTNFDKTKAELNVFERNIGAIKCYESAGFVINSDKRLEREVNGQTWIALNMQLGKAKWRRWI